MPRKVSRKGLFNKAWEACSLYIRKRDPSCATCGAPTTEAGHFVHGKTKPTYFDERNIHGQCTRCNRYLSSNMIEYYPFMVEAYGEDVIDELKSLGKQIHRWSKEELAVIYAKYKRKLEELG